MKGFERFIKKSGKVNESVVSIWKCGQIGFNKAAIKEFGIDEYPYAILYYNKEEDCIGIELTRKMGDGAIRILGKGQIGIRISAKSFLDYCGWDKNEGNFKIKKKGKLLVIRREKNIRK